MSSGNLVRLAVIAESTYGVTPGAGNFQSARFTSEALSGTPGTVVSQQIRTDRMSSGQVVTEVEVGGEMAFELAKENMLESFMESAMYSTWQSQAQVTVDLTIDTTLKKLSRASGDWSSTLEVGDFLTLSGFAAAGNNVVVMVAAIIDADELTYVGPEGMSDETGSGTAYKRADKLEIGTTKKSFTIEKTFLDLTEKAIAYRGMIVATMELNVAFGELVTGTFTFMGNDYETFDDADNFPTDGRTINAQATTTTFNGSVDMPFFASSVSGNLQEAGLDIQSISMNFNNNLTPINVIGELAAKDFSPGTAQVELGITAYLSDEAWETLPKKLTQESFALGFLVKNAGGWYGFFMPAIQVTFDDPGTQGQNQDVMLEMTGQAKVGASGESALVLYRSA